MGISRKKLILVSIISLTILITMFYYLRELYPSRGSNIVNYSGSNTLVDRNYVLINFNTTYAHGYLVKTEAYLLYLSRDDLVRIINDTVNYCLQLYNTTINRSEVYGTQYCFGAEKSSEIPERIRESRIWERLENDSIVVLAIIVRVINVNSNMHVLGGACCAGIKYNKYVKNVKAINQLVTQLSILDKKCPASIEKKVLTGEILIGELRGLCPLIGYNINLKKGEEVDMLELYIVTRPFHMKINVETIIESSRPSNHYYIRHTLDITIP